MYRQDKFEIDTTPKTFTPDLKGLVAWLETQSLKARYCYFDTGECLLAKFFTACGMRNVSMGASVYSAKGIGYSLLPRELNTVAVQHPHTFGAALDRARALLNHAQ